MIIGEESTKVILFDTIWAKTDPFKSIMEHSYEVGWVTEELLKCESFAPYLDNIISAGGFATRDEVIRTAAYITSLHDLSKIHPNFQLRREKTKESLKQFGITQEIVPEHFRHEEYSYFLLPDLLERRKFDEKTADLISQIAGLHHQKVNWNGNTEICDKDVKFWENLQDRAEDLIYDEFNPSVFSVSAENREVFGVTLLYLMVLSDWIASGIFEDISIKNYNSEDSYKNAVQKRIRHHLTTGGIIDNEIIHGEEKIGKLFPFLEGVELRPPQEVVAKIVKDGEPMPALTIICSECGSGKSEAGMYMLYNMAIGKTGLNISLPTCAVTAAMKPRFDDMLQNISKPYVSLMLTGKSWLEEDGDLIPWSGKGRMKLIYPWSVSTVDQTMSAFTLSRYQILKLGALISKGILIDEYHAYDAYMRGILRTQLLWCKKLNIPVVILSATLPSCIRREILKIYSSDAIDNVSIFPGVITVSKTGDIKVYPCETSVKRKYEVNFAQIKADVHKTAQKAIEQVKDGGCLCIFKNTVDSAIELTRELENISNGHDIEIQLIFGKGQTIENREIIASDLIKKLGKDRSHQPKKMIVVSTQILEQSIDVDFDFMFSDLAPIDLLIQRIGRLFRHMISGTIRDFANLKPIITILTDVEGEKTFSIYPDVLLERTLKILKEEGIVDTERNVQYLVDSVYTEEVVKKASSKWAAKEILNNLTAMSLCIPGPSSSCFSLFSERNRFMLAVQTRNITQKEITIAILKEEEFNQLEKKDYEKALCTEIILKKCVTVTDNKYRKLELEDKHVRYGKKWLDDVIIYTGHKYFIDKKYGISKK